MRRSAVIEKPLAAFVHSMFNDDPELKPCGTATELAWSDVRKLSVEQQSSAALWIFDRLGIFGSGHAELLLQIDPQAQVNTA